MAAEPYILYIEDERSMVALVYHALKLLDYNVVGALSGQQGLSMIHERKPDLLLLDLMMPDFNGWDIYRTLKTNRALANIPVIIVTAQSPEDGRTVLNGLPPADGYITKPFDVEKLINSVKNLLSHAQ